MPESVMILPAAGAACSRGCADRLQLPGLQDDAIMANDEGRAPGAAQRLCVEWP